MRFGYCLNMVATQPDGIGGEWILEAAKAGFDFIELPMAETMALDEQGYNTLKSAVVKAGIPCEACNNFFPRTLRLTGADANLALAMDYAERAFARAAGLGAKTVVFGSGPAKNIPEGFPMEKGYEQFVTLLKKAGPLAADMGLTIAIEPLRRFECNFINTFEEGCILAEKVDHPAVKVLVDYYHFTVEEDTTAALAEFGAKWLAHVHFANPAGRISPAPDDGCDHSVFTDALKATGYDGRISCEAYTDDFAAAAPLARWYFQKVFSARS